MKPTPEEIRTATGRKVTDIITSDLDVLFCGINPGLYSAAIGHNFGRPGNRFWAALHRSGFTHRLLSPWEESQLLNYRLGITNFVERATASAAELTTEELISGGRRLKQKVRRYIPKYVAVLGVSAYRAAFKQPKATVGPQQQQLGPALLWVLPNPSGLNAHYQLPDLVAAFTELRNAVQEWRVGRVCDPPL